MVDLTGLISPETGRTQHWPFPPQLTNPSDLFSSQPSVVELGLLQAREGPHQGLCGDGAEVVVAQVEAAYSLSSR